MTMDLSEKIWTFVFRNSAPGSVTEMRGIVVADSEAQAKEIIRTLMVPTIEDLTIKKATTYPLVLTGGYKTFIAEDGATVNGIIVEPEEV